MIKENNYPILELDDNKTAVINPDIYRENPFNTNKLVITFFPEVVDRLISDKTIFLERTIPGENPVKVYAFTDEPDVLLVMGVIGCPACGGNLDMFTGMGINKVMFCGGGGVLDKDIKVGQILVVDGAIRDEGFSYHYIEPSRVIYANKKVTDTISSYLDSQNIPHINGIVWTTDAIFRETKDKVALRKKEGAKIVEMEQAGCLAVSQYRGIDYGAMIYGGDDVSGENWDNRQWANRQGYRYYLVMLCKTLVKMI